MFRKALFVVALVAVSMIAMTPGQADARYVNYQHHHSNVHQGYGKGYLSPWYGGPSAHSHGHRMSYFSR